MIYEYNNTGHRYPSAQMFGGISAPEGYKSFKDAMDNNKFDVINPLTNVPVLRTFEGLANGRTISGYYKIVNNEKIISTWWIKN